METVLESATNSVQAPAIAAANENNTRSFVDNQENQCKIQTSKNAPSKEKDKPVNNNSATGSTSCPTFKNGVNNGGGTSTGSNSTTNVGSGSSASNGNGHNGRYHGNHNHRTYQRPHLRQNFNNYGPYNNGNGGRQGNYNNNNAGNGDAYNSGGYHQNNVNNQNNNYRRNYGNRRHYPGDSYYHQNNGGGHHHYYHNNNHHNYNMNSRSNIQHSQHHNHNSLPPNPPATAPHGNLYHSLQAATSAVPPMTLYPPQHVWPPSMEVDQSYKPYTPGPANGAVTPLDKDVIVEETSPCSNPWIAEIPAFDPKAPPPSLPNTSCPPPIPHPPFPPAWVSSSGDADSTHSFQESDTNSNSDDSLKDSKLSISTCSSPCPKSPGSFGQGDGYGKYGMNYYSFQNIDPDRLSENFKFFEIKVAPEFMAPKDSEWAQLSQDVWNKFEKNQQTTETFRKKMSLYKDVYQIIKHIFPMYGLQIVGSTMSGFGTNTSDVDMCLLIRRSEVDQRFEALDCLHNIWSILREAPFLDRTEVIYAKVPILKFHDAERNLEVDLNCNNSVGIRNTHLLYCYSQQDWRVRPLVLIVKMWAQFQGINDAKNMTISSYSLVLMVIHFLQHGVSPPVLPCLQHSFTEKHSYLMDLVKLRTGCNGSNGPPETWFVPPESFEKKNTQTLGELLVNFLQYFAVKFDYTNYAVSVRTGSVVSIKSCMNNRARKNDCHQWKYICIEEPFEFTNTARSVYDKDAFDRIRGAFFASWQRLVITNDLEAIFSFVQISEARAIGARLRSNTA